MARVERGDEPLDRAALARGVPALEQDEQAGTEIAAAELAAEREAQLRQAPAAQRSAAARSPSLRASASGPDHRVVPRPGPYPAERAARTCAKLPPGSRHAPRRCRCQAGWRRHDTNARLALTVSQAAAELGVSIATVRRWSNAGHLAELPHPRRAAALHRRSSSTSSSPRCSRASARSVLPDQLGAAASLMRRSMSSSRSKSASSWWRYSVPGPASRSASAST